ncbi:MAG TPA: sialate O-acetylesterase [Gammaproteobacteria bacterium]|nr:sialate O-acetylesterase [Gammaproteobacteria bacterium]
MTATGRSLTILGVLALLAAGAWSLATDAGRQLLRVLRYEWLAGQPLVWSVPRVVVDCRTPAPDFIALSFGQSNAANSVPGRYAPTAGVSWFHEGRCYAAADPLPGATGTGGSVWSRLGQRLIDSGRYRRVLMAGIAENGSALARWTPGGDLHARLLQTLAAMRSAGVAPTHLLWHQGEQDMRLGTAPARYREEFLALVDSIRELGIAAPVYVACATYCSGHDSPALRAAQRALVDPARAIFAGPDTDALRGPAWRADDCHFSAAGADRHADLWRDALLAATR